jgi:hypothetical protein
MRPEWRDDATPAGPGDHRPAGPRIVPRRLGKSPLDLRPWRFGWNESGNPGAKTRQIVTV